MAKSLAIGFLNKSSKVDTRGLLCLVILIITAILFLPSLNNGFTNWDDPELVTENSAIRHLSLNNIKTIFTSSYVDTYIPLTILSYMIEYHFFKLNPRVYHTTNLILHLINLSLVFGLFLLLTQNIKISFLVALLFGIHPLRVESVVWVTERKDMLYALFFLSALISYYYYCVKRRIKFYFFTLGLFVLSVLSKPMAVSLPVVLLLLDYYVYPKFTHTTIISKIPFFIISVIFTIVTISIQDPLDGNSPVTLKNIFITSYVLLFYLAKIIVPTNLSAFYPYPSNIDKGLPFSFLVAPLFLIIWIIFLIYMKRYTKKIILGSLFFLLTIFPVSQFFTLPQMIAADRYTYIPSLGVFFIFATAALWIYEKRLKRRTLLKTTLLFVFIGIVVGLSFLTVQRCSIWKDSLSLWNSVLKKYPNHPLPYNMRGRAYFILTEYDRAIVDYTRAIELDPRYALVCYNRADAYAHKGEYNRAIEDYNQALRIEPDMASVYENRGVVYSLKGEFEKALADYNQALKIDLNLSEVYYNRGLLYFAMNEHNKALADFNQAIKIHPDFAEAYLNRADLYFYQGEYKKAITDYTKGLQIEPKFREVYYNRATAYSRIGEYDKAIADYTQILKINPDFAEAYYQRALAYFRLKNYQSAYIDVARAKKLGFKIDEKFFNLLKKSEQ